MRPPTIHPSPDDAEGLRLHQALESSGRIATWEFTRAYLPYLSAWLQAKNARISVDLCEEAASETVYSFLNTPHRFDPTKSRSLLGYLQMSARRDLLNLLRRENRHRHEPLDEKNVELASVAGNYSGRVPDPLQILCDQEDDQVRQDVAEKVRASLSASEQVVLERMLAGDRETGAYAAALGITHLPVEEQRKQVKRVKDRITKRIERMKGKP